MNAATFAARRARIQAKHGTGRAYRKRFAHLVRDARAALVVVDRKVVGYRLPNGQMVCVKERHPTETVALLVMERIHTANWNHHRVPVRAYPCPYCLGWHLTSQARHAHEVQPTIEESYAQA